MTSQIREKILKAALQSITRNGIRAFRVEDLTHHLKISKKTIYQLFPSRIDLVKKCIEKINEPVRNKISLCLNAHKENPMLQILNYTKSFVDGLYEPEEIFWQELQKSNEFRYLFETVRQEWLTGREKILNACKNKGYICSDTNIQYTNRRLQTSLFEARLNNEPYSGQVLFYNIFFRGIATETGRLWLENNV